MILNYTCIMISHPLGVCVSRLCVNLCGVRLYSVYVHIHIYIYVYMYIYSGWGRGVAAVLAVGRVCYRWGVLGWSTDHHCEAVSNSHLHNPGRLVSREWLR